MWPSNHAWISRDQWLTVRLSRKEAKTEDVKKIADFIKEKIGSGGVKPRWASIDLSCNYLGDDAATIIFDLLAENQIQLKLLKYYKNEMTDRALYRLTSLLKSQTGGATEIHLSDNNLTSEATIAFFRAINESSAYPITDYGNSIPTWVRMERNFIAAKDVIDAMNKDGMTYCLCEQSGKCSATGCGVMKEACPKIHLSGFYEQRSSSKIGTRMPYSATPLEEGAVDDKRSVSGQKSPEGRRSAMRELVWKPKDQGNSAVAKSDAAQEGETKNAGSLKETTKGGKPELQAKRTDAEGGGEKGSRKNDWKRPEDKGKGSADWWTEDDWWYGEWRPDLWGNGGKWRGGGWNSWGSGDWDWAWDDWGYDGRWKESPRQSPRGKGRQEKGEAGEKEKGKAADWQLKTPPRSPKISPKMSPKPSPKAGDCKGKGIGKDGKGLVKGPGKDGKEDREWKDWNSSEAELWKSDWNEWMHEEQANEGRLYVKHRNPRIPWPLQLPPGMGPGRSKDGVKPLYVFLDSVAILKMAYPKDRCLLCFEQLLFLCAHKLMAYSPRSGSGLPSMDVPDSSRILFIITDAALALLDKLSKTANSNQKTTELSNRIKCLILAEDSLLAYCYTWGILEIVESKYDNVITEFTPEERAIAQQQHGLSEATITQLDFIMLWARISDVEPDARTKAVEAKTGKIHRGRTVIITGDKELVAYWRKRRYNHNVMCFDVESLQLSQPQLWDPLAKMRCWEEVEQLNAKKTCLTADLLMHGLTSTY